MLLRHLCGAILTLFFAANIFAAPGSRVVTSSQPSAVEFHLASYPEQQPTIASYEKPHLKADTLNEVPAAAAADMKDPLKYSVWVLIGLGPIMWIWLAFFPRIRRK
jgi:hypothetical protein